MKKYLFTLLFCGISYVASAQWAVSFHQSNLPFVGVETKLGERWTPELRVGVDNYIEDISFELVGKYLLKEDEDKQFYLGLGGRTTIFPGIVLPTGINYFPFAKKEFGFHLEAPPILAFNDGIIFRGSFGVRFRFLKN